jgi:hypothetical protein
MCAFVLMAPTFRAILAEDDIAPAKVIRKLEVAANQDEPDVEFISGCVVDNRLVNVRDVDGLAPVWKRIVAEWPGEKVRVDRLARYVLLMRFPVDGSHALRARIEKRVAAIPQDDRTGEVWRAGADAVSVLRCFQALCWLHYKHLYERSDLSDDKPINVRMSISNDRFRLRYIVGRLYRIEVVDNAGEDDLYYITPANASILANAIEASIRASDSLEEMK